MKTMNTYTIVSVGKITCYENIILRLNYETIIFYRK